MRVLRIIRPGAVAAVAVGAIALATLGRGSAPNDGPHSPSTGATRAGGPGLPAISRHAAPRERRHPTSRRSHPARPAGSARLTYPAQLLDLTDWTLTLPVAAPGTSAAMEIDDLAGYRRPPYFALQRNRPGLVFRAPAGGATTPGSSYPRSELRQMTDNGARPASWSPASGTHTLVVRAATLHLPSAKPQVATAQIHSASDDVIQIVTDGTRSPAPGRASICVRFEGITQTPCLDRNYRLGTPYTIRMTAAGGHIRVFFNNVQRFDVADAASGLYFKVGVYTQSNPDHGDAPSAFGAAVIYRLHLSDRS